MRIHDDDTLTDSDLRRRKANAFLGVHGLEHVVDQTTQLSRYLGNLVRLLAQDRVPQNSNIQLRHYFASPVSGVITLLILQRATTMRVLSAVRIVTRSSATCTTCPRMPPSVITSSPFLIASTIFLWSSWIFRCGRSSRK